jgi:glycosyltransferase involved in cell wall biosynthesis
LRILVCNYEFPPIGGGGSPVAGELTSCLAERGHELDVVTMAFRGLPRLDEPRPGLRIFRVPCWRKHAHICSAKEMGTWLGPAVYRCLALHRRRRYDLCHTHFLFPSGVVAWQMRKLTGLPFIVTSHGSDVPGYNPDRFGLEHRLLMPLWRAVVRNASAITFPSAFLRDLFVASSPVHPALHVIPNAVHPEEFQRTSGEPIILFVSRLVPRKGAQSLLAALDGVDAPGWQIHIVGDGPMRAEVEALAARMTIPTTVHGWLDRNSPVLTDLRRRAAIFAFPSLMENVSMVLLEAMASGQAVVTTSAGGNPEVVADTGVLFAPGDNDALREAVLALMSDAPRRRALGEAARARVLDRFNWSAVTDAFEALLGSFVRPSPCGGVLTP